MNLEGPGPGEGGGGYSDCYGLNGSAFEPRCGEDIFLFFTFVQKGPGGPPSFLYNRVSL